MSNSAISIQNVSKLYQLGATHSGSLRIAVNRFAARMLGRSAPISLMDMHDPEQMDGERDFWALRDVSFNVPEGEAIGVIGRNGAGKSTLLKILSRITAPTSGRIEMRGRVASLLEVGTGFHPELTGRENVFLNGTVLGMTRAEVRRHFDAIVEFAGVERFIDTPVKRYSSGMKVRLGFAVAAHMEPEILIVDEVLAVGDAAFQRKCIGKMRDVAQQGRTVLFVSHNLSAVGNLCTTGVVLERGRVVYQGRVEDALSEYVHRNSVVSDGGNLPPPAVDAGAEVLRVCMLDAEGRECGEIRFGAAWGVRIELRVRRPQTELSVAFGVKTGTDIGIFTARTTADFDPDDYVVDFMERRVRLKCGPHVLAAGISRPGHQIQYAPEALYIDVVPDGPGEASGALAGAGLVVSDSLARVVRS